MLPRMVPCVPRKLDGDIGIAQLDAARQPRLRFQAPGVVQLIIFFIIRLGQRGAAFPHIDMAGRASRHHLASVLNGDSGFEQALAERGTALDFEVAALWTEVGVGQEVNLRHVTTWFVLDDEPA